MNERTGVNPRTLPPLQELVKRNWVTLKQLAKILDVTYQTVLRYKAEGKIKAVQIGGGWRVYEGELRRFLAEGNSVTSTSSTTTTTTHTPDDVEPDES